MTPVLPRQRVAPILVALAVAVASVLGLLGRPATGAPRSTVDYVVIAGAPGLRWDDVNPTDTPTLWNLAEHGSIGALAVRSAHTPTCPADGWITLGAGNYARRSAATPGGECPPANPTIQTPDRIGAFLPDQPAVGLNNKRLPWGAVPGALAESVRCSFAVGVGGAVAAARPYGRVDRYGATLPADARAQLAACVLSIVDLGTVSGEDPAARRTAARRVDAALGTLLAVRPERSLMIVAGLSDTNQVRRLHVAVANGPGWTGGWLTSATTGRPGYLQLVDLAPTALAALDEPPPHRLFAGHAADRVDGRPPDLAGAVAGLADADKEAGAQRRVALEFFTVLGLLEVLLLLAAVPLLRRARRPVTGRRWRWRWWRPGWLRVPRRLRVPRWLTEIVLVAAALAIPAALVADAVPWWRSARPGPVFAAVTLTVLVLLTAAVRVGGLWRRTLGPLIGVAAVAVAVVAVDLLTGARLQLNGVAGYSALEGTRYAGLGTVGLGVFVAGLLLAAGCLAQAAVRRWRPALVAVVGAVGVVLVGSPYIGADAGGAVALTAGVCVTAAISTGGWLTLGRLIWATLAGVGVTAGFALMDLRRPVGERGSLGRFLTDLREGTGGLQVNRTGAANVVAFASSPLTILAIAAGVFVWFALLRPWGGLKRFFGLYPAVRAACVGATVACVIAGLFNAAALNVLGAAAATIVPLATLAALRVLDHADDRTVPAEAGSAADAREAGGVRAAPEARDWPAPAGDKSDAPGAAMPTPPAAAFDVLP